MPYNSTHLRSNIVQWAEMKTSELISEVKQAAAGLEELVEKASNPRVEKVVSFLEDNKEYLTACKDLSTFALTDGSYCINITGDIANVTEVALYGYELVSDLGDEVGDLVYELNDCQSLSIFKQIACYKKAFGDIQGAIKEYTIRCSQFLQNVTTDLGSVEIDISKCFSYSESLLSNEFERKINLCKNSFL